MKAKTTAVSREYAGSGNKRACAIMGMPCGNGLEVGEAEPMTPIDHGDIQRHFLKEVQDVPSTEDFFASHESAAAKKSEPEDGGPWSGQVLSLSTVHVVPEAVDFLSAPMNSDKLQIFPNSDSCVMHVTDAKDALAYDLPLCIKDCIRYAWKRGFPWIYFGYEGKEQTGLPTYRSAWDRV